jgi:hypothetical protein
MAVMTPISNNNNHSKLISKEAMEAVVVDMEAEDTPAAEAIIIIATVTMLVDPWEVGLRARETIRSTRLLSAAITNNTAFANLATIANSLMALRS